MIFGKKKDETDSSEIQLRGDEDTPLVDRVSVFGQSKVLSESLAQLLKPSGLAISCEDAVDLGAWRGAVKTSKYIVAHRLEIPVLRELASSVFALRKERSDGFPVIVVCEEARSLLKLGQWIRGSAESGELDGIRLVVEESLEAEAQQILQKLDPLFEPDFLKMPNSTEVENSGFKYYYCISPQSRQTVKIIRQLAENKICRVYLLGGPGSGKTSLAYYYWQCRSKVRPQGASPGNFITVNLTAESTDDKASMKSLLCGHVAGAFPGAQSREGALSFAGDGVCFLDESHGVSGVVMQILMEVLDSNQFLPWGATKKRQLNCAVVFASNRSWEALRELINFDEHSRLGATVVEVISLRKREEDLIAVLASTLAEIGKRFSTWPAPVGLTNRAWQVIRECQWRGNIRTLTRCIETASVKWATSLDRKELIEETHIREAILQWEPSGEDQKANMYL